jgi:alginate O-acetyltransferase complex protein AlgJ
VAASEHGPLPWTTRRRWFDLLLVGLFGLGIALPGAGVLLGVEVGGRLQENRTFAPAPEAPHGPADLRAWLPAFPARFDAWFGDHFGFRELLIEGNAVVTVLWLSSAPAMLDDGDSDRGIDPLARTVLKGRDEWFYYFGEGMMDDVRGLSPMSDAELERWRRGLERRRDTLARRGADYLLVVVPEKQSVYPEHLPRSVVVHGPTRAQQLVAYLRAHSDLPVLDLLPALLEAKREQRVYHRTGTHWNDFGALRATQSLLAALAVRHPKLSPPADDDYAARDERGPARQFLSVIGLRSRVEEQYRLLAPRRPHLAQIVRADTDSNPGGDPKGYWSAGAVVVKETGRRELPRAVVLHDSFVVTSMEPLLSDSFERVAYYWQETLPSGAIRQERPDIVIEERVERFFLRDPAAVGLVRQRPR